MPALAPREARGLTLLFRATRLAALASALSVVALSRCAHPDPNARAATLDARDGSVTYAWLLAREPSAVDVAGRPANDLRAVLPDARVRSVPADDPPAACRVAVADRALLVVFDVRSRPGRRDAILDCGPALHEDAAAIVVAPR